jgi:hypothetical protein
MELRLTDKEHELLAQLLEEQHKHLLREIAKADHYAFKSALRDRCSVLEAIVSKLKTPTQSAA